MRLISDLIAFDEAINTNIPLTALKSEIHTEKSKHQIRKSFPDIETNTKPIMIKEPSQIYEEKLPEKVTPPKKKTTSKKNLYFFKYSFIPKKKSNQSFEKRLFSFGF